MRILLVEDNPGDVRLLQEYLDEAGAFRCRVTHADRLSAGLKRLQETGADVVLLDLSLPDSHGVDTLVRMHAAAKDVPIVVLTGMEDETLGIELVQAGAQDYLVKGRLTGQLLVRALRYAVERKRAEEIVRRTEEKYRSIVENAVEGIFQSTPEGRYLSVNPALARMYGYESPQELIASVKDIAHEIYVDPDCRRALMHLLEGRGVVQGFEYEVYRKDGSTLWISESVRAVRDEQGKVLYYEGTIDDISERKRAEEALRESEERFRAIMDNSPSMIFLKDIEGRYLLVNRKFEDSFHVANRAIIGKTDGEIFPPEQAAAFRANDRKVLDTGRPMEFEEVALHDDGPHTSIVVKFPLLNVRGQCYALCGITMDITDRKRSEEERRKLMNDRLLLLESTGEGIYGLDLRGCCTFINKAAAKLLGYQPDEIVGKDMHTLIHHHRLNGNPYPCQECRIYEAFRSGQGSHVSDEVMWRKDGAAFPVEYSSFPIVERGRITGAVVTFTDITERKRTEERLRTTLEQSRQLSRRLEVVQEEERTRIARELHDELGVALTCIKMDLSRLSLVTGQEAGLIDRFRMNDKIHSMTEFIDETISAVQRIVTELRPPVLDDLGLIAAIEWQAQDFQKRTAITCAFISEEEDLHIDPERATAVFRICQEALTNVARHAHATEVTIRLEGRTGSLMLMVRDNGRGIPEEKVSDTQSLGLIGMRERAKLFGGDVSIKGCPGKGTTVMLHLPGISQQQVADSE